MPKKILSVIICLVLVASVIPAVKVQAAGLTQTQIQAVLGLLQAFGADSATISNVQTALSGGTPAAPATAWCHTFNSNLGYANSGTNEVANLHTALQREGISYGADGTNTYSEDTMTAVIQLQAKYGIIQTGYFGSATRTKINSLYGCGAITTCAPNWTCGWGTCVNGYQSQVATDSNNCGLTASTANIACPALAQACTSSSTKPSITSVTNPTSSNNKMIVYGANLSNLQSLGQVYIDSVLFNTGIDGTKDGSSLFFIPPTFSAGQHTIYVKTDAGTSNIFAFTISSTTQPSVTVLSPNGGENYTVSSNGSFSIPFSWKANFTLKYPWAYLINSTAYNVPAAASIMLGNDMIGGSSGGQGVLTSSNLVPGSVYGTVLLPGQYWVKVCEQEGTNGPCGISAAPFTVASSTSTQPAQPIIITNVQYSPASPHVNDLITTTVTVKNNSSADYNTLFKINVQGTAVSINSLAAGAQTTVAVPNAFTFSFPGTETLNTAIIYPIAGTNTGNTGNVFINTLTFTQASGSLTQSQIQSIVSLMQSFGANASAVSNVQLALTGGTPTAPISASGLTQQQIAAIVSLSQSFGANSSTISNVQLALSGAQPSITVTSPNGGEQWAPGTTHNITWNAQNISQVFDIVIQTSGVSNFDSEASQSYNILMSSTFAQNNSTHINAHTVIQNLDSTARSFSWTVPTDINFGTYNRISIMGTPVGCENGGCGGPVLDWSNNYFSIVPPVTQSSITVISPNGGEQWAQGSTHNITWQSSGLPSTDKVSITLAGLQSGGSSAYMYEVANNIPVLSGSYSWTISNSIPALNNNYRIIIDDSSRATPAIDSSNNYFSIVAQ